MASLLLTDDVDKQLLYEPLSCGDSGSSLLTECMPQLASILPSDCMHHDTDLPIDIFNDSTELADLMNNNGIGKDSAIATSLVGSMDGFPVSSLGLDSSILSFDSTDSGFVNLECDHLSGLDLDAANLFDGIAANDMGSLLEQFEEASGSLPDLDLAFQTALEESSSNMSVNEPPPQEESEVMKLLKADTPRKNIRMCSSAPCTPPSTPPPEMIQKISRSNTKARKSILLPSSVPAKGERGQAMQLVGPPGTTRGRHSAIQSVPSSPIAPLSPTKGNQQSAVVSVLLNNNVKAEAVKALIAKNALPMQKPLKVNTNSRLRDVIKDHDYCQHSPPDGEKSGSQEDEDEDINVVDGDEDGSVLKSLLLNNNLKEELKKRTSDGKHKKPESQPKQAVPKHQALPPLSWRTKSSMPRVHSAPQISKLGAESSAQHQKSKSKAKSIHSKPTPIAKKPSYLSLSRKPVNSKPVNSKHVNSKHVKKTPPVAQKVLPVAQETLLAYSAPLPPEQPIPPPPLPSEQLPEQLFSGSDIGIEVQETEGGDDKVVLFEFDDVTTEVPVVTSVEPMEEDPTALACELKKTGQVTTKPIIEPIKKPIAEPQKKAETEKPKKTITIDELISRDMERVAAMNLKVPSPLEIASESMSNHSSRCHTPEPLFMISQSPGKVSSRGSSWSSRSQSPDLSILKKAPMDVDKAPVAGVLGEMTETKRTRTQSANRDVVDMEIEEEQKMELEVKQEDIDRVVDEGMKLLEQAKKELEEEIEREERFDKFKSERNEIDDKFEDNVEEVNIEKMSIPEKTESKLKCDKLRNDEKHPRKSRRNYRKKDSLSSIPCENNEDQYIDKMPNYFTALSRPQKIATKKTDTLNKLVDNSVPDRDRDPSPDQDAPVINKLPAYFNCFTNSTKYSNEVLPVPKRTCDPLGLNADLKQMSNPASVGGSASSSRSHSPNLVIASRANSCSRPGSRAVSKSRSRSRSKSKSKSPCKPRLTIESGRHSKSNSESRSRSRSSSWKSRSRDRTLSKSGSKKYHSRSRSGSRSKHMTSRPSRSTYRKKRHSYSSSRSSSRSQSRSRSRSPVRRRKNCSSRSSSRSKSRSRSRSRRRDRSMRSKRRRSSYSRERSWERERERDQLHKEKKKRKQIEERRIVYVGRIPPDFTRHDLRRQFEKFGEIMEVSVHFREHGGDHYGFVTFEYTCDAYAAIEGGNKVRGMENYDLCFGGRRQFCDTDYADLDGNQEVEEEMAPVLGRQSASFDFDALLQQAKSKISKHKH